MGSVLRGLTPPPAASSPRRPPRGAGGPCGRHRPRVRPSRPRGDPAALSGPEANRSGAVRVISVSGYESSEAVSARPLCLRSRHGVPTARGVRDVGSRPCPPVAPLAPRGSPGRTLSCDASCRGVPGFPLWLCLPTCVHVSDVPLGNELLGTVYSEFIRWRCSVPFKFNFVISLLNLLSGSE